MYSLLHHIKACRFSLGFFPDPVCRLLILYDLKTFFRMVFWCVHGKPVQKIFKFESLTQQIGFLCIQRSLSVYLCIGKIIIHRNICDDGCKFFAHHCLIPVFYNIFGCTRWLYHIRMCMNFLNASILSDQRSRCFFSNSRHTRNIVCRIPHQGFYVDKFLRCHLIPFFDICRQIIFNLCSGTLRLWNTNPDMIRSKLQQIAVPGYDRNFHPGTLSHSGKCTEKIIGFVSFHLNGTDPHRRKHFFHQRNLLPQGIIHRFSCSLICLIHFMTKSWCMNIKCNRQIIRLFLL